VRIGWVVAIMLAAGAGGACDESPDLGPTPNLEPTFSSIQREIFNNSDGTGRPACIQCHTNAGGRAPDGGLVLLEGQSYANLVGVQSTGKSGAVRVIATNADGSYLIQKLEGASTIVGARMPFGGPYLTQGQIDVIREWIRLGARND
jgi:hypothetical protein